MKLILSSCDFHNPNSKRCIIENTDKPLDECKILFIPNETASKKAIRSEKYYLQIMNFGFRRENIYVFDYYDAASFYNLDIDLLYIGGGNTFQTLDRLKKRNFTDEIIRYIKCGTVYVGGSAGAHIVSQNIEHVLRYDNNKTAITDFKALGLFDGIFVCHYSEEREDHFNLLKATSEYDVYALTNDNSIVYICENDGRNSIQLY